MLVNAVNQVPAQFAPAYYQYTIDRIFSARREHDTVSKALKCIGLYSVIVRLAIDLNDITRSQLAAHVGVTLPGLIRPLEYLTHTGVISLAEKKLPGKMGPVAIIAAPQPLVDSVRRDVRRRFSQEVVLEHGFELPYPWQDTVGHALNNRTSLDTPAKVLKSLGLIPFITRLAAVGLPITRPILARRLSVAENTLTPLIRFLCELQMIESTERRIIGNIGNVYSLTTPRAVAERVRREIKRLEKLAPDSGWPEAWKYREFELESYRLISGSCGHKVEYDID